MISEDYHKKIKSIEESYPRISKKLYQEGECGYFFILDKTENIYKQNITC